MNASALSIHLRNLGLHAVQCEMCCHRGYWPEGPILILFGGQHEQLCSYGPSTVTLKILFSAHALRLFEALRLSCAQSATYATRWALLSGQVSGSVKLNLETPDLVHCYDYINRHMASQVAHAPCPTLHD